MIDRSLKSLFSLIAGLLALTYLAHNLANIGPAFQFFTLVTSHADQAAYPVTLFPVPPAPLIYVAMALVFALELAAGVLLVWGAWRMWSARGSDAATFQQAKSFAKIGHGCAIANWWGMFQVIAVAGYQIWQMPAGAGPDHGSWVYGAINAILLIYLSLKDD